MSDNLSRADALSPEDAAQVAALDEMRALLVADARSWAAQLGYLASLGLRAERAGAQVRRTLALELAGSWQIGQLTAERWLGEADRFHDALPRTLAMLGTGELLRHQAVVLLHRTSLCTPQVAQAVEAEVLPAGAQLCPADLGRLVDRVRLRIESEQNDPAEAERQEAQKVASRRTYLKATEDGMAVAGAVLTPEQGTAWAAGMDTLERRERIADREAGIVRTAEQRRADIFASLPALVLAGTAQDIGADARDQERQPWTFAPEQVAAQIVLNVHVPVSTVLELSQEPGSLDRYGPVSAEHIRLLRPKSFRRVMVDAFTGRPIAVDDTTTPAAQTAQEQREQVQAMLRPDVVVDADEPQHDPSARLARLIDLRDVRCCGPGCSASRCDRDHLTPWPAGPTSARNLGLASPRCHSAKHHEWNLQRHPDGSVTWHSPLHRTYHRPGPWPPPPEVDLHADLPPLRPPPTAEPPPDSGDDTSLLQQLTPPQPAPPPEEPDPERAWPDDPPPF